MGRCLPAAPIAPFHSYPSPPVSMHPRCPHGPLPFISQPSRSPSSHSQPSSLAKAFCCPPRRPPVCRCLPAAPIIKFAPFLSYRQNAVRVQFAWPWLGVMARGQTDREAGPFCAFPPGQHLYVPVSDRKHIRRVHDCNGRRPRGSMALSPWPHCYLLQRSCLKACAGLAWRWKIRERCG